LRPNVSFKKAADGRGHKGVGATFLAYGYSFIKLQSKRNGNELAAVLRQGRQWAEDTSGTIPRPKFSGEPFNVPELKHETSGTCVELIVGQTKGERPKNLGWRGAHTAQQWFDVLRLKTPLGGVYLETPPFHPSVTVIAIGPEGTKTEVSNSIADFYYPHEIPNLKVQSLTDLQSALSKIQGDPETVFAKLSPEYKRLDCLYEIWPKDSILADESPFASALTDDSRQLIERHNVVIYGAFLRSAKLWNEFNDEELKLKKNTRLIHGGLQLASDYMIQGDLMLIPLTHAIGYQNNSHVIVHFTEGNPDLGRKVFQPELKELAEVLSVRTVNTFKKYIHHLKPDTGAPMILPDKELHDWKIKQEEHRNQRPLTLVHDGVCLSIASKPQQEQDVVALFHELLGMGILRGYQFLATSQSDKYDSLFCLNFTKSDSILFDKKTNAFGVNRDHPIPYASEPKVLEYKYDLDSLIADFDNEIKFPKQIELVICWTAGTAYREKYHLKSLLIGDEGSDRRIFGATHQAYSQGGGMQFELIILEDLVQYIADPASEEARQRSTYRGD
jgi:hypothetical protein